MRISRAWLLTCGLLRSSVLVRGTIACQGRIENWGLEEAAVPLTPALSLGERGVPLASFFPESRLLTAPTIARSDRVAAAGTAAIRSGALPTNPIGGGGEIVHDEGRSEFFGRVALDARAVAGADEETFFYAGIPAALEVNEAVTDHVALGEVEIELVASVEKELRGGFSAAAGLVGGFGCDVDFFEGNAVALQLLKEMAIDALDIGHGEKTASHAGLVGDDE